MFPFQTPLKISENLKFSDAFRWYRNGTLAWNKLIYAVFYRGKSFENAKVVIMKTESVDFDQVFV